MHSLSLENDLGQSMNTKKLNVAIIGCGRIAGHHCQNIVNNPNLNLTAVCDLDCDKAKKYATQFHTQAYVHYRQMFFHHPEIDLVAVITPSGMHFEHSLEIIEHYKKHIIVEKPTFLKLSQFHHIAAAAKKSNVHVFPVFQNRYNKAVQKVHHTLNVGSLGDLRLLSTRVRWCRTQSYYDQSPWRGTFAMDGGVLTNQGIHHLDLLRYLGGEIIEVQAIMKTFGVNIEVEDTCVALLKFQSGALGTLEITTAARPQDFEASVSLVGSKGIAKIGGIAVNELQEFVIQGFEKNICELKEFNEDFSESVYGNGHKFLYRDIVSHIFGKQKFPQDLNDSFQTLKVLHALYRSHESGGLPIKLMDGEGIGLESKNLGKYNRELSQLYQVDAQSNEQHSFDHNF